MEKNIIGKNIKILRKNWKETQEDLAFAIGLEGPTAIANYEKGTRTPPPDMLKKIANHYRTTVESIVENELGEDNKIALNDFKYDDKEFMYRFFLAQVPKFNIVAPSNDIYFKQAYDRHCEMEKEMQRLGYTYADFEIMIDLYKKSYEFSPSFEAAANYVGLYCYWLFSYLTPSETTDAFIDLANGKIDKEDYIKYHVLPSYIEEDLEDDEMDENNPQVCQNELFAYIEENPEREKHYYECLRYLKSSKEWYEWADFFICLRYRQGSAYNDSTIAQNNISGHIMLCELKELGNPHAKHYLDVLFEHIK